MADYLNIAGRVRTTASDGVAMEAQEVKDLNLNKSQQEINADVQTELGDRYTKEETYSKEQLDDLITTPDVNYVSVVATDATTAVTDVLPATGEANTIYRVGNWDGTQYDPTMYALYAWNGSAYVCLAVRSFVGEVYDISVNHPDGQGNPTPYADLAAAIGTSGENIPADIRRGGMRIQFVRTYDSKYVQYRLMSDTWSTVVTNWQGIDDEPIAGSDNLVKSGGVSKFGRYLNKNTYIEYGKGVSINDNEITYRDSDSQDCIWISIPKGTARINLNNAQYSGYFLFFSSPIPSTETYIAGNTTGDIPSEAAILCLKNLSKSLNTNEYDGTYVTYDFIKDAVPTKNSTNPIESNAVFILDKSKVRCSSNSFRIEQKKAIANNGDVISVEDNEDSDLLLIYIQGPYVKKVAVTGAVLLTGTFYNFNDLNISSASLVGTSSGDIHEEAVLCAVNISRVNSSSDYYETVNVLYEHGKADSIGKYEVLLSEKTKMLLVPDSILENKRVNNGEIQNSSLLDVYVYNNIDPQQNYVFSGFFSASVTAYFISYWDSNDEFISFDKYKGSSTEGVIYKNAYLNVPTNAATIKMNVLRYYRNDFYVSNVVLGEYINIKEIEKISKAHSLKVVVNPNKSFYVRCSLDESNDGILVFDYIKGSYGFVDNCIMMNRFYTGTKQETDNEILAKSVFQDCHDCQSPMFTNNFGPMFSNHGYSTPRVVIPNHGLSQSDIGSEWVDQNNYHYTIGNIVDNTIYLLPVIYSTGVQGEETRDWKWYSSPYPTSLTRNVSEGETLSVSSSSRWDYQVSELRNIRVLINGKSVEEGTYYCDEVELAYEQIGYNPIFINTWWPTPIYNGIMLVFSRHYTVNGGNGFISLTANTVVNNKYPYPIAHYIDVVPMFPFKQGNYKPYIYIPKMNKHDGDIDFRKEFVSVDGSHAQVSYNRNDNDITDVDDMPDRAYCYLKTDGGDILFGCAGGHSLVRGMSVKSIRNNYIGMNRQVGSWYPSAGNKFYNNILEYDNINNTILVLDENFINEFEGYMCWYKPQNGVHCFYHRTKDGYVVYMHTNQTINKGYATLPDFMNNFAVDSIVEKTNGITLKTNTVIDGKIFFSSDNSEKEYNWAVFILK